MLTAGKRVEESEAAMKTQESRFQVHDELTAPERSVPVLKGALAGGGQLSNYIGVLAGSPAVLRAYARFRSELRNGALPLKTQQRIALAVAQHQGSEYWLATLQRTAREAGIGLDEIALAREFDSGEERDAVLLRYVKALLESEGAPPVHLHEEAREADWSDEQILEAIAHVALAQFTDLVTRAGDVPRDGSADDGRLLRAA
jgi:alkylhydroperoxidase family enzyme